MASQNQEALKVINAGLLLDPDSRSSLLLKSSVLQALGQTAEAKKIEERAEFLPEGSWTERSEIGAGSTQGEKK